MQTLFLAFPIAGVLLFFSRTAQMHLRRLLDGSPEAIWAVPFYLTGFFALAAAAAGVFRPGLAALVLAYTLAPVACVFAPGAREAKQPGAPDLAAILCLWLPLEFAAGGSLVPPPMQGFLHSVAYGVAILLALTLFSGFRRVEGLKCALPHHGRDAWLPLAGFAVVAPVLAVVGIALGFIPPPHLPVQAAGSLAVAAPLIFLGTALPEEILFRSLIQNLLAQRFGAGWRTLVLASVIFGCAHLDNGPQPLPNWRYAILATVAGVAYGKVFEKSSSVLAPAGLHMLVDWTKHFFF